MVGCSLSTVVLSCNRLIGIIGNRRIYSTCCSPRSPSNQITHLRFIQVFNVPFGRSTAVRFHLLETFHYIIIVIHVHKVVEIEQPLVVHGLKLPAIESVLVQHFTFYEFKESYLVVAGTCARDHDLWCHPYFGFVIVLQLLYNGPTLKKVYDTNVINHGAII